jgi:hypothetical protein
MNISTSIHGYPRVHMYVVRLVDSTTMDPPVASHLKSQAHHHSWSGDQTARKSRDEGTAFVSTITTHTRHEQVERVTAYDTTAD